jgi:hypothetical protein
MSAGSHSYKITAHGKADALCEGSFNCRVIFSHGVILPTGTYSLDEWEDSWCGKPEVIKVVDQTNGSKGDCLDWIAGTNKTYGENGQYNCYGTLTVTYPIQITVPTGKMLQINCNTN